MQTREPRHGPGTRTEQKVAFRLGSARISDSKATPNPLQANYMHQARDGAGHWLVNSTA